MAYDVRAVANWFIDRAKRDRRRVRHLKLQRLAFIAHAWHLAERDAPLVDQPFEAWRYGPVSVTLYRELGQLGNDPIRRPIIKRQNAAGMPVPFRISRRGRPPEEVAKLEEFLEGIWRDYGDWNHAELVFETNFPKTCPWAVASRGGRHPFVEIPDETIRAFYAGRLTEDKA